MSDLPESREVMMHRFQTEMTRLERESLERFSNENMNRWTRVGELDELWTALRSHESIDNAWLAEWQERTMSVLKGEPRHE